MKPYILIGLSILLMVILASAVASITGKADKHGNHTEVVLREIGHQLLLTAKDSSSRVLPIEPLGDSRYRISFQNDFGFISDSLINVVQRTFRAYPLASGYIVRLRDCKKEGAVLAFEINSQGGDLSPCRGRRLATGCYLIEIELLKENKTSYFWWLLLIIPVGLAGFFMKNGLGGKAAIAPGINKKATVTENQDSSENKLEPIPLGNYQFYPENHGLTIGQKSIPLSQKETKALTIFAANIDQVVDRETLMKAIWEEEGVVVISRNVDVLVSKLRKKLSEDNAIQFVNVHGREYKFVIG
jgi:hypothetical protein